MKVKILSQYLMIALFWITSAALAQDGKFAQTNSRRDEINYRLHKQNRRIHKKVKSGALSKRQAVDLHASDRSVKKH